MRSTTSLVIFCVVFTLFALCHLATSTTSNCYNSCVGVADPNAESAYAAAVTEELEAEEEEVTVANYHDFEVVLSEKLLATPNQKITPFAALPTITTSGGTYLVGSTCIAGCSWYQFKNANSGICTGCNKLIKYDAFVDTAGVKSCYRIPEAVLSNQVTAAQLESAKQQCVSQGCNCGNTTITSANAGNVVVYWEMAQFMVKSFIDFYNAQYVNYFNSINAIFNKNKKACKFPLYVALRIGLQNLIVRFPLTNVTFYSYLSLKGSAFLSTLGVNKSNSDAKLAEFANIVNAESVKARAYYQEKYNNLMAVFKSNCPQLLA